MNPTFIGESALYWSLGDTISQDLSERTLRIYRALKGLKRSGALEVLDVVPSYTAITVYFCPVTTDIERVRACVDAVIQREPLEKDGPARAIGKTVELPVHYDGDDLERVAHHCGRSPQEVVHLHSRDAYTVAVIGFQPHFPYLIGLPEPLTTPRRDRPRIRIPAGSVAIGGAQTGVYPRASPGGWNLIGTTDPNLLIPLEPGDRVLFRPTA